MPLLARRRLKPFTLLFAMQSAVFVATAAIVLPSLGLTGAALAYGLSMTLTALAAFAACHFYFHMKFERRTALGLLRAAGLLGATMAAGFTLPFGPARLLVTAAASAVWLVWTLRDEAAREALRKLRTRRAAQ